MNPAPTPATTTAYDDSMAEGATMAVEGRTTVTGVRSDKGKSTADRRNKRGFRGSTAQPLRKNVRYLFQGGDAKNHPNIPFSSQTNLTANSPAVTTNPSAARLNPNENDRNPNGKV